MTLQHYAEAPETGLSGSLRDFRSPTGSDLLGRVGAFYKWQDLRRGHGLWPYGRSTESGPKRACAVRDDSGARMEGVNLASQDYISLSAHPAIVQAAKEAIDAYGVHSAGSPALVGNTSASIALEQRIARFLQMREVVLYPTGWAAGFGVIQGLVRPNDHVLIDALAHACLQVGAAAASQNVVPFRHNNVEDAERKLARIRARDPDGGILVVTESLFSMDSDTPDLSALQAIAHKYGATLLVDVAHDLGCMGEDGRGAIGAQNMTGKLDLVMGSFSKTFASNGGFVACRDRGVKEYLRYYSSPCTFSNAMSPVQATIVAKAFDIVESLEGADLRQKLLSNILTLRNECARLGMETYGEPSPIVCVKMGEEGLARLVARRLPELGLIANLVEYPAVAKGQARFRMQVMAKHSGADMREAASRLHEALQAASVERGFDENVREMAVA